MKATAALLLAPLLWATTSFAEPEPMVLQGVLPADGSTVPRNARLTLFGASVDNLRVTLCDAVDDDPTDCVGDDVVLSQTSSWGFSSSRVVTSATLPLQPGTAALWATDGWSGASVVWDVVDVDDNTPPTPPELLAVEPEFRWVGGTGGSDQDTFVVEWGPGEDDFGIAHHRVERKEGDAFVAVGWRDGERSFPITDVNDAASATYRVVAIDIAGNESEPSNEVTGVRLSPPAAVRLCRCVQRSTSTPICSGLLLLWVLLRRRRPSR